MLFNMTVLQMNSRSRHLYIVFLFALNRCVGKNGKFYITLYLGLYIFVYKVSCKSNLKFPINTVPISDDHDTFSVVSRIVECVKYFFYNLLVLGC
jgi:hypothetical protein